MRTRMILRAMTIRDVNSLIDVVDSVFYGIIASGYFPYSQMSHRYD